MCLVKSPEGLFGLSLVAKDACCLGGLAKQWTRIFFVICFFLCYLVKQEKETILRTRFITNQFMLPKAKAEVNLNIAPVSSITKTFSIAWDRKKLNPLNNKRVRRLVLNFLNTEPSYSISKTFSIAWDRKKLNPLNNKRVRRLVLNFLNTEPSFSISKTFSIAWDIKKTKPSKQQAPAALSAKHSQHSDHSTITPVLPPTSDYRVCRSTTTLCGVHGKRCAPILTFHLTFPPTIVINTFVTGILSS